MRKTKAEALKTRSYLLKAALEVFSRLGVTRTSLQAIAQEAGVTRGALYWHFENKEDLFEALFEQKYAVFLELLNDTKLQTSENVWQHLRNSLHQIFQLIDEDEQQRKFCIVMSTKCEQTEANQTITELAMRYHQISRTQIENTIKLSIAQGTLPEHTNANLAALYLESNLVGLMTMWASEPERFNLPETATKIIEASMYALEHGLF